MIGKGQCVVFNQVRFRKCFDWSLAALSTRCDAKPQGWLMGLCRRWK